MKGHAIQVAEDWKRAAHHATCGAAVSYFFQL